MNVKKILLRPTDPWRWR